MMWCMAIGRSFLYDVEDENFNRYVIFHVILQMTRSISCL